MINLEKVKLIVFDFDNTLCIHLDYSAEIWNKYDEYLVKGKFIWDETNELNKPLCIPSEIMRSFINWCSKLEIKMFVCSATNMAIKGDMKCKWCSEKYNYKFENVSVDSSNLKVYMCELLASAMNLEYENVLLVDDKFETLESAGKSGFQTAFPLEIAEYMNKLI